MRKFLSLLVVLMTTVASAWAAEPEYVEIGGLRWATMNLGASTVADAPETAFGDYYAWGATTKWYNNKSGITYTWNPSSSSYDVTFATTGFWKDGYTDGYSSSHVPTVAGSTLSATEDIATITYPGWRMATSKDFKSLADACNTGSGSYTVTKVASTDAIPTEKGIYFIAKRDATYKVPGMLFIDKDGASVFFPAAGNIAGTSLYYAGAQGRYWSSSMNSKNNGYYLNFGNGYVSPQYYTDRYYGLQVRPVKDAVSTITTEAGLITAINNVTSGGTVKLDGDIDLTATIKIESAKNFTLDLNGHVLNQTHATPTSTDKNACVIYNQGTLNIIDNNPTAEHSGSYSTLPAGGVLTGGKGYYDSDGDICAGAIDNCGTLTMTGGTIYGNTALYGGGIYNESGSCTLNGVTLSNNTVGSGPGGAIYSQSAASCAVYGCKILNNKAGAGAGIYSISTNLVVDEYTVGGVTTPTTISGNEAELGGGITIAGPTANGTISNTTITGNKAICTSPNAMNGLGGGVAVSRGKLTMKNVTVTSNEATSYGGGIGSLGGTLIVDGCTITGNKTNGYGGAGIMNVTYTTLTSDITLKGNNVVKDNTNTVSSVSSASNLSLIGTTVKLDGVTSADATIGVSKLNMEMNMQTGAVTITPTTGEVVSNCTTNDAKYFFADDADKYKLVYNETGNYLELLPVVTLNSKGYGTFSSAKDVDVATDGIEVYSATVSDETITLTKQENKYIPAGIGVLLYGGEAKAGTKVTFKAKTNTDAIVANDLKPTTTAADPIVTIPGKGTIWALGDGNEFLTYNADAFIANRAFLRTDVPAAKGMTLVFGDETTGVANVDVNVDANQAREGKFIENGRIVILKNGRMFNAAGQRMQ